MSKINKQMAGEGKRYNEDKPDYSLIYTPHLAPLMKPPVNSQVNSLLASLGDFQLAANASSITDAYKRACSLLGNMTDEPPEYSQLDEVVKVWRISAGKYSRFNWMAGMKWSICMGCINRHLSKLYIADEQYDPETGCHHMAHVICNIQMLMFYTSEHQEGNDLPCSQVVFPNHESPAAPLPKAPSVPPMTGTGGAYD